MSIFPARLRTIVGDIAFVTKQGFTSDRWSATQVAVLTVVLALVPSAQVIATAALIGHPRTRRRPGRSGVAVVIVIGLSGPLATVREAIAERSMLSTEIDMQSRLSDAVAAAQVEGHSRAIIDAVSHVYVAAMAGVGWVVAAPRWRPPHKAASP